MDNGSTDPLGYIYSAGTQLASSDDSDGGKNFKFTYYLTAGTAYVIAARMYLSLLILKIVKSRNIYGSCL